MDQRPKSSSSKPVSVPESIMILERVTKLLDRIYPNPTHIQKAYVANALLMIAARMMANWPDHIIDDFIALWKQEVMKARGKPNPPTPPLAS
jgi:hypothetical protein